MPEKYSDIINGTKYPKNTDPADYYFRKADTYSKAYANYTRDNYNGDYRRNLLEKESWHRGELCENVINNSAEKEAIDRILSITDFLDERTRLALINEAIEEMQRCEETCSVSEFVDKFLNDHIVN